ncbi:MAG TPA: hypothetical protein DIT65_03715 [Cryomorphaceae bacterium]|nr:hypothetical protein [Cryomorphaceae bacterium]
MKLGIITYYWPPAGGPGVQRWLKLSKYLAREGVELFIVTVEAEKATYPLRDEGLKDDVADGITVIRTGTSEKFGAYKKVTGKKQVPFSGFSGEDAKVSMLQKIARFVRGNFFVPDARKGWNSHAYRAAEQIILKHDVRHWITTSPPHSTQLIGLQLKRNHSIHWTADFRDPWTDIYYYRKFYPTALTRAYERGLERKVFSTCDSLLSVSPSWSILYQSKGAKPASKVYTVTNGFDAEDFTGQQVNRPENFTITYAGTLASQYPVADFITALNQLDFPVIFRIIGSWDGLSKERLENAAQHVELEFIDYVSKKALNAMMMASHLSLFLLPEVESAKGHIPGKLFDYLGAGNPILGLGPVDGDASVIIRDVKAGEVFSYGNTAGIVDFLKSHKQECLKLSSGRTAPYERSIQAQLVIKAVFRHKDER